MNKWVYRFSEGNASMRALLGGKGANLAEMTGLGMPIPQGFTVNSYVLIENYYEKDIKEKPSYSMHDTGNHPVHAEFM